MPHRTSRERIVFALDVPDLASARRWTSRLAGEVGVFKVGLELFVHAGPDAVAVVRDAGARCFLDLKLHDIPETVARAVRACCGLGVDYLTLHAAGGWSMIAGAVAAARDASHPPTLLAVTVLTSIDATALAEIGFQGTTESVTSRLAQLASAAGAGGLVCSAQEVATMRALLPHAVLATPGIRPAGSPGDDQRRTATAAEAVARGADLVVIGRPIRDASDPVGVARAIAAEIDGVRS